MQDQVTNEPMIEAAQAQRLLDLIDEFIAKLEQALALLLGHSARHVPDSYLHENRV
jgi:hypothetical protein